MLRNFLIAAHVFGASVAHAGDAQDTLSPFVVSNVIGIFHHEFGHALIDIAGIPIFGQEEDAADVFSIFMINATYDEEAAEELAYDAAFGFLGEAQIRDAQGAEIAWWDVHGVDEQRYYNTVCIFYGADPEGRADFAEEFGLPEDRAEYCPMEYDAAEQSWGAVLDEISTDTPADSIVFAQQHRDHATSLEEVLGEEVAFLNENFKLPQSLEVRAEKCGEPNAFYDPEEKTIVFCEEFIPHLKLMEADLSQ